MSEQTSDVTTSEGQETQPQTSPQTGQPTTAQPPAQPSPFPRDDVYAPDGKRWRDKVAGYEGALKQVREKADQSGAQSNTRIQELEALLESERTAVADLKSKAAQIPAMEEQIQQLSNTAAMVAKLRHVMQYPDLLRLHVEEQVEGEEGQEPSTVSVNPILRLVENTTLEGDELAREIARLAKVYEATRIQPSEPLKSSPPVAPTPAQPSDNKDSIDYWKAEAKEAHEMMNAGELGPEVRERFRDAWVNVRRLEAAAAVS